jgi:hypothetical protein
MNRVNGQLVLELARDKLQYQLSFADALDAKLATLFAVGSTLIGLLAAVLALGSISNAEAEAALLSISIALYGLLTVLWWLVGRPKRFSFGPQIDDSEKGKGARSTAEELGEEAFARVLIQDYLSYCQMNESTMDRKDCGVQVAFVLVALETGCLAAAGVLALLG